MVNRLSFQPFIFCFRTLASILVSDFLKLWQVHVSVLFFVAHFVKIPSIIVAWNNNNNNRERIERFRKLKALYNLKKNIQCADTHNYTNQWYTSIQNIRKWTNIFIQSMAKTHAHKITRTWAHAHTQTHRIARTHNANKEHTHARPLTHTNGWKLLRALRRLSGRGV